MKAVGEAKNSIEYKVIFTKFMFDCMNIYDNLVIKISKNCTEQYRIVQTYFEIGTSNKNFNFVVKNAFEHILGQTTKIVVQI